MKKFSADHFLSISALVTAVVAVWIAVVEQRSNREYQRLSVEPYIELANTNRDGYERLLTNSGLGPARVQTVEVKIDGKDVSNWRQAIKILASKEPSYITTGGLWNGRQIQAGETITLVHLTDKEIVPAFHRNVHKMKMKICYCSMYKECWIKENSKLPVEVTQCPSNGKTSFPN